MQFSRFFSTRLLVLCLALSAAPAFGAGIEATYPQVRGFFPQADRFGDVAGEPPAAAVYRGRDLLGYVFLTFDVVRIPAYSGRPINTLVGFDLSGRITGVQIVGHEEPILLAGISENQLQRFVAQYRNKGVFDRISVGGTRAGHVTIDTISGATITVMVENATLMQSVRRVALARGLDPARLDAPNATRTTVTAKTAPAEPIWIGVWQERVFSTAVLGAGLVFLTLVLIFQDWLARHPKLLLYVRDGFLLYTLFFIGWYGLAQLSVVNVLTFSQALTHGFQWESFLIDPMMFILWAFVAATLLLWGRGVYCGWLCPFGALQELTFQLARRFTKLPFFEMPQAVHERLWALKYIILLALFGISLQSLSQAERLAEVEPFKTAITLRFQREWGFVLFAAAMVLISAFNRKFYCKYLCALGAALTIPGKFRIFDWLRRHRECGRPCQVCATECEVQAIRKNGEINANECHYCLDCQVIYYNDKVCLPLIDRRKRREQQLVRGQEAKVNNPA